MRRDLVRRIERHLDETLGKGTRIRSWRREIVTHMEDAYAASADDNDRADAPVHEDRWRETLARFGDVKGIADQLREEYKTKHLIPRLTAFACAVSVLMLLSEGRLMAPIAGFIAATPLFLCLAPFLIALTIDVARGSCHWDRAQYAGTWGSVFGAFGGLLLVWTRLDRFNEIGPTLAVSLLSALYGLIFFAPKPKISIVFLGVVALDMVLLAVAFDRATPHATFRGFLHGAFAQRWSEDLDNTLLAALAFSSAGVLAGLSRFGFKELRSHSLCIATTVFYLCTFHLLTRLGSIEEFARDLLVAITFLPITVIVCSALAAGSGFLRRAVVR